MRWILVECNSKTCMMVENGYCKGFLGCIRINATEFDNNSTCPPMCETSESKDTDENDG